MRACARCGNLRRYFARFPDGHVCRPCVIRALGTRGDCPGCGRDRPLIGRLDDGTATCGQCAGITRKFTCRHCGYEGPWCVARTCMRCRLRPKVEALRNDGTGKTRAELKPLADYICTQLNP